MLIMKSISLPVNGSMHQTILQIINNRRTASSNLLKRSWSDWDKAENTYRAWRVEDKDDKESERINSVKKIVVPVSFAQVQTNLTFLRYFYSTRSYLSSISS